MNLTTATLRLLRPRYSPLLHVRYKSRTPNALPRNEEITYPKVSIRQRDGTLVPHFLRTLLRDLDRVTHRIELVEHSDEEGAIVRIVDIKEEIVREKHARGQKLVNKKKNEKKEVQFTWGAEDGDMEHKLRRVMPHLEVGAQLVIVFSVKKRTRPPRLEEQQAKVAEVIERVADFATPWREVGWQRNMAIIYLRGIPQKKKPKQQNASEPAPDATSTQTVEAQAEIQDESASDGEPPVELEVEVAPPEPRTEFTRPEPGKLKPIPADRQRKAKGYIDLSYLYKEDPVPPKTKRSLIGGGAKKRPLPRFR
uniref:Translation initiation factor 3 N-terminal domain-containing protein n=1 Tax=Mycena chlorophos TaxID=658473 RepID=A0ABQ0L4S7_MYCCL|nr:predicted protein [Mycena chlorophos]